MPIFCNFHPCLLSRSIQSRIRLWPAFDCPRFDSSGSIGHPYLSNEHKQGRRVFAGSGEKLPLTPRHPNLQRMLEAQKMVGIDSLNLFGKVTLLLGRSTVKVVSHEGWPRGGWGGCLVTNILTNPEPTFFLAFNKLAHHARIAGA